MIVIVKMLSDRPWALSKFRVPVVAREWNVDSVLMEIVKLECVDIREIAGGVRRARIVYRRWGPRAYVEMDTSENGGMYESSG